MEDQVRHGTRNSQSCATPRRRRAGLATLVALAGLAAAVPSSASTDSAALASFIRADKCAEHQAFFDGDPAAVAARLPASYTPELDPSSGRPLLFARGAQCQITVGSNSFPATMGVFGIVINSPDGRGCSSGAPGVGGSSGQLPPVCNWFPIEWVASDQRIVDWLRTDSPGPLAVLVPGLSFKLVPAPDGSTAFSFNAPSPAPSPFSMSDVGHPGSATINVRGGYWFGSGSDAEKLAFSTDDITPGQAAGTVSVAPGSEAAKLTGADQASYSMAYTAMAGERWSHGSYRRQLLGAAPDTHTFSGSCSISGVDTFDPPASNTAQDLHLTYEGKGTCSGKLDGQPLSNASVTWHSQAHSYGSCSQANTVEPGIAALAFPNGAVIESTFDFSSLGTQVDMSFYGVRSGFAPAQATFLTPQTGPDAVTGCAGAGDRQVPMDLSISTDTPLVSPLTEASPGAITRPPTQALHLVVRPRAVPVGAPTTLRFAVSASGRPIARALVMFQGARARTDGTGVARLHIRLARPGPRRATARKPGFRRATALIHVVAGRG